MLTAEENEMMTQVGPGTPAGELLRRYWHPVAIAADLTPENPTMFLRRLGEDLVLFRSTKGEIGLLHDRCTHRGVSLSYGRVEERGLACAYHGWLYDIHGNCLETPAEPPESKFCLTVKHKAYPVKKLAGLFRVGITANRLLNFCDRDRGSRQRVGKSLIIVEGHVVNKIIA
jgi:nitrite reductase/ring-hydroxylating ferredoxin subunit